MAEGLWMQASQWQMGDADLQGVAVGRETRHLCEVAIAVAPGLDCLLQCNQLILVNRYMMAIDLFIRKD